MSRGLPGRAGLVTQGYGGRVNTQVAEQIARLTRPHGRSSRRQEDDREVEIIVSARLLEINGVTPDRRIAGAVAVKLNPGSAPRVRVIETTARERERIVIRVTHIRKKDR